MKAVLIIVVRALGYAAALAGGSVGFLGFLGRIPPDQMGIVLAGAAVILVLSVVARRVLERRPP